MSRFQCSGLASGLFPPGSGQVWRTFKMTRTIIVAFVLQWSHPNTMKPHQCGSPAWTHILWSSLAKEKNVYSGVCCMAEKEGYRTLKFSVFWDSRECSCLDANPIVTPSHERDLQTIIVYNRVCDHLWVLTIYSEAAHCFLAFLLIYSNKL